MNIIKNNFFKKGLDFVIGSLRREREICSDLRIKWLKDLYLNLFYDNPNKKFQCPTAMQALLAFGGRQFNMQTLEANLSTTFSNLLFLLTNTTNASMQLNSVMYHLKHQKQHSLQTTASCNQQLPTNCLTSEFLLTHTTTADRHSIDLDSGSGTGPAIIIKQKNSIGTNSSSSSSLKKRKSSTSFRSLKLTQKTATRFDATTKSANKNKKTSTLMNKLNKFKSIKRQKSLIYDLFLPRSSSASFERQNSAESANNNNLNLPETTTKTTTALSANKKFVKKSLNPFNHNTLLVLATNGPMPAFRTPLLLSLIRVRQPQSMTRILVSPLIKNTHQNQANLSSSSGVSTLKSGRSSNCWSNHSNRSKNSTW